jgi:hypothetical protein
MIVLLDRLGAADNDAVLTSARELNLMVTQAGAGWDELLRPPAMWPGTEAKGDDEGEEASTGDAADGEVSGADKAEAARLIDRLLARKGISDTLRQDLGDLKEALRDGSFEAMDLRYVRALARRLGV